MTVTAKVRKAVLERDGHACVCCGQTIIGRPYSLQHRRAKKLGGSRLPWIDQPQNLITVLGSATTHCHGRMEARGADDKFKGYVVSEWPQTDPRLIPVEVMTEDGRRWMWLTPDGQRTLTPPADAELAECGLHASTFACDDCDVCRMCGPCQCELAAEWAREAAL